MKLDKKDYEFSQTIKAEDAVEKEVKIQSIREVATKYGNKFVALLDDSTQIFLNSLSMQNLMEAFGDDTDNFIGKRVKLTIEVSERTRGKKTIVLLTGKEKKK